MTQVPAPTPEPSPSSNPGTVSTVLTDLLATARPAGPVAEAGTSTSEFKLTIGTIVADAIGLATAFGAPIDAKQQAAIIAFVASISGLTGVYTFARSIRKAGTSG